MFFQNLDPLPPIKKKSLKSHSFWKFSDPPWWVTFFSKFWKTTQNVLHKMFKNVEFTCKKSAMHLKISVSDLKKKWLKIWSKEYWIVLLFRKDKWVTFSRNSEKSLKNLYSQKCHSKWLKSPIFPWPPPP